MASSPYLANQCQHAQRAGGPRRHFRQGQGVTPCSKHVPGRSCDTCCATLVKCKLRCGSGERWAEESVTLASAHRLFAGYAYDEGIMRRSAGCEPSVSAWHVTDPGAACF